MITWHGVDDGKGLHVDDFDGAIVRGGYCAETASVESYIDRREEEREGGG